MLPSPPIADAPVYDAHIDARTAVVPVGDAPADAASPDHRCLNCGAGGCEDFCPRCGQETHDLHRSLHGILGELLDAFAGWDGKIPSTLWTLVRRPGALTAEFFAGRRARYLRPLRIYLTMSLAFFLSIGLVKKPIRSSGTSSTASDVKINAIQLDSGTQALVARHQDDPDSTAASWLKGHLVRGVSKIQALPKEEQQPAMLAAFMSKAPNMVFLLLPVFALLLRVLYAGTPVFYAEHFVFALHNHAFAFLAMTLAHLASVWLAPVSAGWIAAIPLAWMPVYFFLAMRRVYGGSRRRTTAKFVALSAAYGTIFFFATVVTVLFSLVTLG